MFASSDFFGRVQRRIYPCGVPLDPDSCPCSKVERSPSSLSEAVPSAAENDGETISAISCQSITKLTTDDIEISICLDRIFSIFCQTLEKLELSASLPALLEDKKLSHLLNGENFKVVTDAFQRYVSVKPCSGSCFENLEVPQSPDNSLKNVRSNNGSSNCDPAIYRAIEILSGHTQVREMVKQLRPEYSEQAQLFLGYMKYFMGHSLKRMHMSPEELRGKDLHYRKLWRDNEKAKIDLRLRAAALDEQREHHDKEMEVINSQCEKDLDVVKRVNRKCKEDITNTVIRSERKMMMMYKASEVKQKDMREDVNSAESHLKTTRAINLALEKEARDKRFKIETQLLAAINKYDTEIGEKQKQMEFLIEQFNADKKQKEELEAEIESQAELYDSFMKERQEASDAIINEKLVKLMVLRAVKLIQRWWRKMIITHNIVLGGKKKTKKKKNKKKK